MARLSAPSDRPTPVNRPRITLSRRLDLCIIALDQLPRRPRRDVLRLAKRALEAANHIPDSRRRAA